MRLPHTVLAFLALATAAYAQSYPPAPAQGEWIVDGANLIAESDRATIRSACASLHASHQTPLMVVTVTSMASCGRAGWTIEQFGAGLFDSWGTARDHWAQGILIVVSRDDRKARIECGRAWGGRLNAETNAVMQRTLVPQFKSNRHGAGLAAAVLELARAVLRVPVTSGAVPGPVGGTTHMPDAVHHSYNRRTSLFGALPVLVIVIIVVAIVKIFFRGLGGGSWHGSRWHRRHHGFSSGPSWGSSRSSSFGGGGGRRGGGFSGGGGASGSW